MTLMARRRRTSRPTTAPVAAPQPVGTKPVPAAAHQVPGNAPPKLNVTAPLAETTPDRVEAAQVSTRARVPGNPMELVYLKVVRNGENFELGINLLQLPIWQCQLTRRNAVMKMEALLKLNEAHFVEKRRLSYVFSRIDGLIPHRS